MRRLTFLTGSLLIGLFVAGLLTYHLGHTDRPYLLAFAALTTSDTSQVYLYDLDQHHITPLGPGTNVQWSPRGTYLAISSRNYTFQMNEGYTLWHRPSNTFHHDPFSSGITLAWSPDEQYLALVGGWAVGLGEAQYWLDILNGDGTGSLTDTQGLPMIPSARGSAYPIYWIGERELWIPGGPEGESEPHLLDRITRTWKPAEERAPIAPRVFSDTSRDGHLRAMPPSSAFDCQPIPRLRLVNTSANRDHAVPLPPEICRVTSAVWMP
jgi:hypothetical protein